MTSSYEYRFAERWSFTHTRRTPYLFQSFISHDALAFLPFFVVHDPDMQQRRTETKHKLHLIALTASRLIVVHDLFTQALDARLAYHQLHGLDLASTPWAEDLYRDIEERVFAYPKDPTDLTRNH